MQSYQFLSLKKFTEHVWTCPMWIDNSKTSDANWYDSTNMSRLFLNTYDVIWYNRIISCQSWNSHVNMFRLVWNFHDVIWYNSTNMSRLVQVLWHDLIWFCTHIQTCSNIMTQFDTILQTCPDLFKYYDMIWYDSKTSPNLSMILWHDLIGFYKHVQTCSNIMIQLDTILQLCPDLFKYYDTIWYDSKNMSKLVHDIMIQFDTIIHVSNMSRLV
jgi:hypothetical protein